MNKQKAIIVDIDDTISNKDPDRGPFDWDRVLNDVPIFEMVHLVRMYHAAHYKIIFSTARDEECRDDSRKWLENHLEFSDFDLLMRWSEQTWSPTKKRKGTFLPGYEIKKINYEKNIKGIYEVAAVFDDLPSCIDMYKGLGFLALQIHSPGGSRIEISN